MGMGDACGANMGMVDARGAGVGNGTVYVRGGATPEELAAVLAVVAAGSGGRSGPPEPYLIWRATRLQALRRTGNPRRAS